MLSSLKLVRFAGHNAYRSESLGPHIEKAHETTEVVQIAESECDEMKNRLRAMHEAAEQKQEKLKNYEACLEQQ